MLDGCKLWFFAFKFYIKREINIVVEISRCGCFEKHRKYFKARNRKYSKQLKFFHML